MRWLARLRSSVSSMLPVPLNSSKITWSMRQPVSIRHVARMVRLAAVLDFAGGAEEALGDFEGAVVEAAGHGAAAAGAADVEGSAERA